MFEKIKTKIDEFEEKATDFVEEHPTTIAVSCAALYVVVLGGVGCHAVHKERTNRMLVKEIAAFNKLLTQTGAMD